ncbi:hypothetical protein SLEP1_g58127 [Rubroshorea leprosula]|uniref:Uncharacterized protein n=1 Tax=Rubroshorea leprosula TaxID=152421 RepID=A0AAV5MR48_9ROSI|nr:hypothetical protein SLEP1_g58127 [Rubroshorea leprosula]
MHNRPPDLPLEVREFPAACRRPLLLPAAPVLAGKFWFLIILSV